MELSPSHLATREAACRLPALHASLALLVESSQRATLGLYGDPPPASPGDPPAEPPVVVLTLTAAAGQVDEGAHWIVLDVPLEGQIDGADPAVGTSVTWARITDGAGQWWADATVSDEAGAGEIRLIDTLLYNGAFCRLTSAILEG
ncbi:hypothetical protein [Marichromatium sp. AB31]|uniref:hypothetical protein n=1 Tax=Marichromatium sp. AB31 TaxID=2483362 RepID=UPI0011CD5D82|nr:hypothetical protein [Marichromatium sp. AB31]